VENWAFAAFGKSASLLVLALSSANDEHASIHPAIAITSGLPLFRLKEK